ncbi:peptidylprolyl isomerase [Vibrio scophthalmi]|uniref:Peptidyl-prolyl cis-trans isomerase n=1 Tax=Vibrio scophthalmi TaxID=45658 RepID=A0A1B1NTB0_9VIBR|nr:MULTISPECIES: peptidylprolyl isomerase [Vibrio]ANS86975.1 Peptidylprolyl isomerase [Vibrio scophthalmi]EGU29241.1 peptidyl-prolyl cis-trans isomerase B [Vibrio sp. N418]MCY9802457.1 peptidylprolyl isomerase [Vibrio scophthalmi]ODS05468.1 Peptidylprolyl isomerase [Vibrio scophthalmi]
MIVFTTNFGDIEIELNMERAPVSSKNFLKYCEDGFYEGTIFHRVIDGFMIQGGGHTEDMREKETRDPIVNEANRGLKNTIGSIAMARTDAPHSATAQFFINLDDNDFLDHTGTTNQGWGYAVFGKVSAGMDVVNNIGKVLTGTKKGHDDVPLDTITISKVTIK